jgi:NADH-quinone oxidoreductase subunit N
LNYNELIPGITQSLVDTLPLLVLIGAGLVTLVADILLPRSQRGILPVFGIGGIFLAFFILLSQGYDPLRETGTAYFGVLYVNHYLVFLSQLVILAGGLFLFLISPRYIVNKPIPHGEYYGLLTLAIMSMMALAASSELLTLFLNIEVLSITLYVLAGLEKRNARSTEAAFKYFLLGSFAAAFLLFGIAFIFGSTGALHYHQLEAILAHNQVLNEKFLVIGIALVLVGFAFKLTLAPFHMYAPDVYDGAATPIAAAIASGAKVAGFVALYHFIDLLTFWNNLPDGIWTALYTVAVISMLVGNIGAVTQPYFKRMLAYSSIAHSGYMLIPLIVVLKNYSLLAEAREALAYYLMAYTVMTLLAFGVAATIGADGENEISRYAGLSRRSSMLAAVMTLSMLSLLGFPLTVGFFGKVELFSVAVAGEHYVLAVLGVLASIAGVYYYLRVIVTMYMQPSEKEKPASGYMDVQNVLALSAVAICVLFFAFFPSMFLFIRQP